MLKLAALSEKSNKCLINSFYFNQHMHYTFVVIYTLTYVSTTY
jgi:hypothetical protein